ncbi:hypothetical protein [Saccharopolyspora sp. ASAGF58]|uniref:hypothetical protein n=1 Tax=Saccharopolyspora sp. ASAGF58 TaxID=2719023 RepID=UPI0014400417|nr:hypothetical protein [Saccharopolyspora sp. ASAGF58]QIZ35921.1 hypothetical protein FDZ84_16005 [Saccharopolyspora sp. ASAGF58]
MERELIEAYMDCDGTWQALAEATGQRSGDAVRLRYRRLGGTRIWPAGRPATSNTTASSAAEQQSNDETEGR